MSELMQLRQFLATSMSADPLLCLAQTVAWLDPFWNEFVEDDFEDGDSLRLALHVLRDSFPALYAQVIERWHTGESWREIDCLICSAFEKMGIPLEDIEFIGYGIPLPVYGAELGSPEFYEAHPDLVPVAALFGIDPGDADHQVNVPQQAWSAGRYLAADIEHHADDRYRQLSWLLQWLFSCSGNSCIDYDYEMMNEVAPLSWEQDNIDFAVALIEEANEIMGYAMSGLDFLTHTPEVFSALHRNVQRLYKALAKQEKEKRSGSLRVRCVWPSLGTGTE